MLDHTTIYVVIVMFLATLVRSIFGFGEGLIAVPLLALRVPTVVAAPLAVVASVLIAGAILIRDYRKVEVRSALGLVAFAALGTPLGLFLLISSNDQSVKIVLGLVIITSSLYSLLMAPAGLLPRQCWVYLAACGFSSGVLGGAYGINGPPLAIYGALQRWSPQHFRATLQAYFLPVSLLGLLGYGLVGILSSVVIRDCVFSLPGMFAAIILGRFINSRFHGDRFFRLIHLGLVVIGVCLMIQVFWTWKQAMPEAVRRRQSTTGSHPPCAVGAPSPAATAAASSRACTAWAEIR